MRERLTHVVGAKPGHEYTKQNVKFLVTVLQNDAVRNLQKFAENNEQTQGKFTIGDEKVRKERPAAVPELWEWH